METRRTRGEEATRIVPAHSGKPSPKYIVEDCIDRLSEQEQESDIPAI